MAGPLGLKLPLGCSKGLPLAMWHFSPSVILVCRGQGHPRQYILAVWIPFVRPRAFLPPRHGPWT